MKKFIAIPVVALALVGGVTACGKKAAPIDPASASAAKQEASQYISKCVPVNDSLAQIKLAKSLTDANSRDKLAQCLGIPQDQRQNFEADALSSAEHVSWSDKGQRTQYFEVTLPNLAEKYHSKS